MTSALGTIGEEASGAATGCSSLGLFPPLVVRPPPGGKWLASSLVPPFPLRPLQDVPRDRDDHPRGDRKGHRQDGNRRYQPPHGTRTLGSLTAGASIGWDHEPRICNLRVYVNRRRRTSPNRSHRPSIPRRRRCVALANPVAQ